jgi:MarR family transcriptional regulator, transcriptional regulator for hemolysin
MGCMENNLCWLLSQTSHVLMTEMTAALEELGLSPRSHSVLMTAMTGELTQSEIAQAVGLDKTTMVVTVDELEAAGLAERRPSKSDRRARVIAVTRAGRSKAAEGQAVVERTQREVLQTLPAREREALVGGLNRLVADRLSQPVECEKAPRRRQPRAAA